MFQTTRTAERSLNNLINPLIRLIMVQIILLFPFAQVFGYQ